MKLHASGAMPAAGPGAAPSLFALRSARLPRIGDAILAAPTVANARCAPGTGAPGPWKVETTSAPFSTPWTPVNILPTIPAYNRQSALMSMSGSNRSVRLRKL